MYEYSIQEAKKEIKDSIRIYLQKDEAGRYLLADSKKNPFYVVGEPGIGKTEMVKQIADELEIGFFATSVTHHTRNSVLGLPTIVEFKEEKMTEYTMPDMLAQIEKRCVAGETEGILLIDEFASMSEALVAPMLAFLQSKCIGNHYLPEGWILLLCSNPPEYNETAREFDAAVMDRVRYMRVTYSEKDFLLYAEKIHIHPLILDYVRKNPERAYVCGKTNGKKEIVTARSWENLSNCIYGYETIGEPITERLVYQFIKSEETAYEFCQYYVLSNTAFRTEDISRILNGDIKPYLGKIRALDYEKKWRVVKLLQDELLIGSETIEIHGRYLDYLQNMICNWMLWAEKDTEWLSSVLGENRPVIHGDDYYFALNYLARKTSLRILPDCLKERVTKPEWQGLEEQMAETVMEKVSSGHGVVGSNINPEIVNQMQNWYVWHNANNMEKIKQKNNQIKNALQFLDCVGDPIIRESFVRNMNQQSSLLYVLAKSENKAYVKAMTALLGEND